MDFKEILQAFFQFLTDLFAALNKFLGVEISITDEEETDPSNEG